MIGGADAAPLIVTALLPGDLHRRFTQLRRAHFPPDRNYLEAHVTLFHALPASALAEVRRALADLAASNPPLPGIVEGVMSLGRGTAIRIASADMLDLRDELAARFHGLLTAQDGHRPRLHVTIQNKVAPEEARALYRVLDETIERSRFSFRGLGLYAYRGGPWEGLGEYIFRKSGGGHFRR